jgi:predicted site-specific integrase-resolvase
MVREYADTRAMLRAIRRGQVPSASVSPGWAVRRLGITRQAVYQLIERGLLDCWRTRNGDLILVRVADIERHAGDRAARASANVAA